MNILFKKIKTLVISNKIKSFFILLLVILIGWFLYSKFFSGVTGETRYVLGNVKVGTIVSSVSASGQISSLNQLDIKTKASGEVVDIRVSAGDHVTSGQIIALLDTTEAAKSVRDAEANLESAQIALEKLKKPASDLTLTQAQNALDNAKDSLEKLYSDSNTDIANVFLDWPNVVSGLQGILTGTDIRGSSQWNMDYYKNSIAQYDERAESFRNIAYEDYKNAKTSYDKVFSEYQLLAVNSDKEAVEKIINHSYDSLNLTAKAVKSANAFIQLYIDVYKLHNFTPNSIATTAVSDISTYASKVNSHLSVLLNDVNSFKQNKQSIIEKQQSLSQVISGADALDVRSSELSVTKAKNSLSDAKNNLANYYIRAPFDGTLASLNLKKFDTVGSGTVAGTIITNQKIAELSLNEVDAAKVKAGDKATLTFDAIDELTLTGVVNEVDAVGTVTQGVVSYSIKIKFDTQDERIKSGMTVNASIITDIKQDVLIVPGSAIKIQNGISFVQVFTPPLVDDQSSQGVTSPVLPKQQEVKTGIFDDLNTEIISGVTEGQQIVTRTITSTTQTTQSAPSLFGAGGIRTGAVRTNTNTGR